MKYFIAILLILLTTNIIAQWNIVNQGFEGGLASIYFIDENVGWIAGEGLLLKTVDGGDTWQSICDSLSLTKVDFINETLGWAIGGGYNSSRIYKTTDGGYNWSELNVEELFFSDLIAVSDSVVYAVGLPYPYNNGKILKTEDGGTTWINVMSDLDKNAVSIHFINNDIGMAVGSKLNSGLVLKTDDGGVTWNETITSQFFVIYDLQFINDSTGYFLAIGNNHVHLCATRDTLNSYTVINIMEISSFHCINDSIIYAVTDSVEYLNIMKSTDGGFSWEIQQTLPAGQGYGSGNRIYFKNSDVGFIIVGSWGHPRDYPGAYLWKTMDGNVWEIDIFSYPFHNVSFIDINRGFAGGGIYASGSNGFEVWYGGLFYTNDGGTSWNLIKARGDFTATKFINNNMGFTLDRGLYTNMAPINYFYISKTSDGGLNWYDVYHSWVWGFFGTDIHFLNNQFGWVVGNFIWTNYDSIGPALLSTSDGGENWDVTWKRRNHGNWEGPNRLEYPLMAVHGAQNTLWAVGDSGLVIKSFGMDSIIVLNPFTDLPLKDVYFSDENHGWILGEYYDLYDPPLQTGLFRTINGGITWQEVNNPNFIINDMFFKDSLMGWAVGSDTSNQGMVLLTTDGGDNWIVQIDGLPAPLFSIDFNGNYGWVVGELGLVLKTENGGITWLADEKSTLNPKVYKLSQNYPNPFNPSTNIEFSIPKSDFVTLKVYNILGEEVATLVSERLNTGKYKYDWDASKMASGVYLYKIEAGDYVEVKKMILMK